LVLHGPNLSALGTREPAVYGRTTLREIDAALRVEGRRLGLRVRSRQSNHEGVLIDELLASPRAAAGVLLNAGAYAHTSLALADAVRAIAIPVVEVHLSNTAAREQARHAAPVGAACVGRIEGFGPHSYLLGLSALHALLAPLGAPAAR
jgi:3-dehydroquinate dehydratase-2